MTEKKLPQGQLRLSTNLLKTRDALKGPQPLQFYSAGGGVYVAEGPQRPKNDPVDHF